MNKNIHRIMKKKFPKRGTLKSMVGDALKVMPCIYFCVNYNGYKRSKMSAIRPYFSIFSWLTAVQSWPHS